MKVNTSGRTDDKAAIVDGLGGASCCRHFLPHCIVVNLLVYKSDMMVNIDERRDDEVALVDEIAFHFHFDPTFLSHCMLRTSGINMQAWC